jgi:hypothetical protein
MDDDACGAIGGMTGKENRNTQRKPAPVPQIPHDLTWYRILAAAVAILQLTSWVMTALHVRRVTVRLLCNEDSGKNVEGVVRGLLDVLS